MKKNIKITTSTIANGVYIALLLSSADSNVVIVDIQFLTIFGIAMTLYIFVYVDRDNM